MELEKKLRELLAILISNISADLTEEELSEIKEVIKYSDDPEELDRLKEDLVKRIFSQESFIERLKKLVDEILRIIAEINDRNLWELKGKNLEESLSNAVRELIYIKERLECVEKERIEHIKSYLLDLVDQLSSRTASSDVKLISEYTIERLKSEPSSVFRPEIFKRIQDIIIEKEKEIETERKKLREQLKKVLRSIINTINSLSDSENAIIGHLNEHLSDIEGVLGLDNLDDITERLTQLSARLRETINKIRSELKKAREELNRSAKTIEELKRELEKYKEIAVIDELTGVLNRRGIIEILEKEMSRAERFGLPLSVAIMDIDDFKKVNDTYGHVTGDKVLKAVALVIKNNIRKMDFMGRYGGEEFLVVFPNTSKESAKTAAEKLVREIEKHRFKYKDSTFKVTISAGVAQYSGEKSVDELIAKADEALYRAKSLGKNRVEVN